MCKHAYTNKNLMSFHFQFIFVFTCHSYLSAANFIKLYLLVITYINELLENMLTFSNSPATYVSNTKFIYASQIEIELYFLSN